VTILKAGNRVRVSTKYPAEKLAVVGLAVGDRGTIVLVIPFKKTGIAIVKWDNGSAANANLEHLELE
jgi:hypothetical protein